MNSINSLKNKLIDTMLFLDVFGQQPDIRILNKTKFSTILGFVFSVGLVVLTSIYFIIEYINMVKFINPNVVSAQTQIVESSTYYLLPENFTIAITVADININPIKANNTHYSIVLENCVRERIVDKKVNLTTINSNCTTIPLETCSIDNFQSQVSKEVFSKVRFGSVQCIQKDFLAQNPPTIQGAFSATVHRYLKVQFRACQNTTKKQDCAPKEQIEKILNAGYYHVYMTDNLVRMDQTGKPFEEIINQFSTTFSAFSSKQIYHQLMVSEAKSDMGLVLQEYEDQQCLISYEYREAQEMYNQDYIVQHIIRIDPRKTQYNRSYIKLQSVLSKAGGFWQIILLAVSVILKPLSNALMSLSIINKLFVFEVQPQNNNKDQQKVIKTNLKTKTKQIKLESNIIMNSPDQILCSSRYKQSTPDSARDLIKCKDQVPKQLEQQFNKDKQKLNLKEKQNISLNIYELLKLMVGCKFQQQQQIEAAKQEYLNKLDVVYIIEKFHEIDKLKLILLNSNQNIMFNLIQKPIIPINLQNQAQFILQNTSNQKFCIKQNIPEEEKLISGLEAYKSILNQTVVSEIDQQLLNYIDVEVKRLFDNIIGNQNLNVNIQQNNMLEVPDELIP